MNNKAVATTTETTDAPIADAAIGQSTPTPKAPVWEPGKLYYLRPNDLRTDPHQARKNPDPEEQAALNASIAKYGVIQPVIFRVDEEGNLILVGGERRTIGARSAKLPTIPAVFISGKHREIALVENLQRSDLSPLEEAEALKALKDDTGIKSKELALIVGKSESVVCDILSLAKLPDVVKDEIRGNKKYSRKQLAGIVGKDKNSEEMITAFEALKSSVNGSTPSAKKPVDQLLAKVTALRDSLAKFNYGTLDTADRDELEARLKDLSHMIRAKTA